MDTRQSAQRFFLGIMLIVSAAGQLTAQQPVAEFAPGQWDLGQARITEHLGRQALAGTAFMKGAALGNGVIEVDIATTAKSRSYPGLLFRVKDGANYERVYVRPHRSPFYDDALQYGPVFNGVDSWQLYNGPGLTAALEVAPDRWNRLKVVVADRQAQVFWNDDPDPVLVIDDLAHGGGAGSIGLAGPLDGTAFFSNLRYAASDALTLPPPPPVEEMPGRVGNWEISAPMPVVGVDFSEYPAQAASSASWKAVTADRRGLVDVSRHFSRGSRVGDCILARATLAAESDSLMGIDFGYSDIVTVFLNRRPVYSGNSAYRSRDPSFLGIVGYHDSLYLPLRKGDNELLLLLGETQGGWAFCLRRSQEVFAHPALKRGWKLESNLALPEAVVFDPGQNVFYVSNYFNEGQEFVSRVSATGEIIAREWVRGLRMPTGMLLRGQTLYVVDRTGLKVVDTRSGEIRETVPLPGVRMANDVAMDTAGNLYISDTPAGIVYRLAGGRLEPWLENLNRPNGLLCEKNRLLVGQNEKVVAVGLKDRNLTVLALFPRGSNIDGIEADGHGGYLVGDHGGRLYRLGAAGGQTLLLDTSTADERIADFAFVPGRKLLLIPTFDANTLAAYSLELEP